MVYQGSKSRIAKYICPIIQQEIDKSKATIFIDAFVGGANLIQHIQCENKIGYDLNPYLISLLKNLDKVEQIEVPISKKEYNQCREFWKSNKTADGLTEEEKWRIGAIGFIASFGGRFYDGGYAKSSCSQGKREVHCERKNNILKQAPFVKECQFEVKNFFDLENLNHVVIYCDPPYAGTSSYPYDNYDKEKFWNKVRELSKDNTVFVSEKSAPEDFKVCWEKEIRNILGSSNSLLQNEKLFKMR